MSQRLTTDSIRHLYPEDKWILLLPAVTKFLLNDNPMYGLDVTEVGIDPDDPALVYPQEKKYNQRTKEYDAITVSLTKLSIDRISNAAGVSVRLGRSDTEGGCIFKATALLNTPGGGGPLEREATCEWSENDARERIWSEAKAYVWKAISKKWDNFRDMTEEQTEAAIEARASERWGNEIVMGKRKIESSAINRAVAMVLGLARTYKVEVLRQKRFAVVRFVFVPDMSDPQIKQAVIAASLGGAAALYPSAGAAPQQQVRQHEQPIDERKLLPKGEPEHKYMETQYSDDIDALVGNEPAALGTSPEPEPVFTWAAAKKLIPELAQMMVEYKGQHSASMHEKFTKAAQEEDAEKIVLLYDWLKQRTEGPK